MRRKCSLALCALASVSACSPDSGGPSTGGEGSGPGDTGGESGGATQGDGTGGSDGGTEDGNDDGGSGHGNCPDAATAAPIDGMTHLGRGQWSGSGGFIEIVDVVANGTTVYACTGTQGMMIWDATGTGTPTLLSDRNGGAYAHSQYPRCQHVGHDFDDGTVVITNRGDEVQPTPFIYKFDISNPGSPVPLVGWQGPESIEGVAVKGDTIYAAAHTDGLMVFEDQGGATLTPIDQVSDGQSDAWQPVLSGDTLIVAEGHTGLRIYDVSGQASLVSTLDLPGSAKDVVVRDDVAYVAASTHIVAVDVSNPAAPALLGDVEAVGTALAVAIGQNDTLVTAQWDEIRGYDITDPAAMRVAVSEVVPTTGDFSRVLAVDAVADAAGDTGRVYAGEWEGMHAYAQSRCDYGPDIWVSPQSVQFGQLATGESDSRVVLVRNTGNQLLAVTNIQATGQLTVDKTSLEVEPGKAGVFEVTFTPKSSAELSGGIGFVSNDIDEPEYPLWVTGNVAGRDVGDPVPAFDLFDLGGTRWTADDLVGEVVVLAYFATF